jgi:CheY-like chemotaxis protein
MIAPVTRSDQLGLSDPGGTRTVLVVDDEADTRLLFVTVLSEAGFDVAAASDGRDALKHCAGRDPDVIVVDLLMPLMDGVAFARAYRRLPSARARILVVSALSGAETIANSLECDAVLRKPLDMDDLVGTVVVLAARGRH